VIKDCENDLNNQELYEQNAWKTAKITCRSFAMRQKFAKRGKETLLLYTTAPRDQKREVHDVFLLFGFYPSCIWMLYGKAYTSVLLKLSARY